MDDSYGFGVLGKTGRGTCEHFGINVNDIEILIGNLVNKKKKKKKLNKKKLKKKN